MATMSVDNDQQQLANELNQLLNKPLARGDTWYLVEVRWLSSLLSYLQIKDPSVWSLESKGQRNRPGPVDNSRLLESDNSTLKEYLMEETDYRLVPQEAWNLIVDNFGICPDQKPIARKVIETGLHMRLKRVEIYLLEFDAFEYSSPEVVHRVRFSREDSIKHVVDQVRQVLNVDPNVEARLSTHHKDAGYNLLDNLTSTVGNEGLFKDQRLVLEKRNPDGTWPREETNDEPTMDGPLTIESSSKQSSTVANGEDSTVPQLSSPLAATSGHSSILSSGRMSTRFATTSPIDTTPRLTPGLCGLSNLGNTCFMNSIIQCLSNCPPIPEYFANDNYLEDINEDNPLGMGGKIARSFGELIKSMWSGRNASVVPRKFKMTVGNFAPRFSGYAQHDSQELLTFLLDGLHEDLNRVKRKPYIELKDSNGRPDEELALEAWSAHKQRNDSVILDLFHGLLKSTVVCPECPKVSVTFDPYSSLTLPLPAKKERKIELFLVSMDPTKCVTQFKVSVIETGRIRDLCVALSQISGISADKMIVTDVYKHRFHKIFVPDDTLDNILEKDDIFVFEVPTINVNDSETFLLPIYLRNLKSMASFAAAEPFGHPMVISVPRDINYEQLYSLVLAHLSRFVTPPLPSSQEEWWKGREAPVINGTGNSSGEDDPKELDSDDDDYDDYHEPDGKGPPKLFLMRFVNSYGTTVRGNIENDQNPVTFNAGDHLTIDWFPGAKARFYDEKKAEEVTRHSSMDMRKVSGNSNRSVIKLKDCLELYTTTEKLSQDDAWYCPSCKKHQEATKKFDIWSLPSILVISLKRFSYTRFLRDKIDAMVQLPTRGLDMEPFIINKNHEPAVYDLVAVSNHYGGLGGGHYTAYAKNKVKDDWFYFDDSSVSPASEDAVVTKAAYVLFYMRRDLLSEQNGRAKESLSILNGLSMSNGTKEDEDEDVEMH